MGFNLCKHIFIYGVKFMLTYTYIWGQLYINIYIHIYLRVGSANLATVLLPLLGDLHNMAKPSS